MHTTAYENVCSTVLLLFSHTIFDHHENIFIIAAILKKYCNRYLFVQQIKLKAIFYFTLYVTILLY